MNLIPLALLSAVYITLQVLNLRVFASAFEGCRCGSDPRGASAPSVSEPSRAVDPVAF